MRPGALTGREHEVLALLADGLQTKQVAAVLGISRHTVNDHVRHIYEKLGVRNRVAATRWAFEHGVLALAAS
jgi:DNA-binding CsgD family transcriptional regulator